MKIPKKITKVVRSMGLDINKSALGRAARGKRTRGFNTRGKL